MRMPVKLLLVPLITTFTSIAYSSPLNFSITPAGGSTITGSFGSITDTYTGNLNVNLTCMGIPINLNCGFSNIVTFSDDGAEGLAIEMTDNLVSSGPGGGSFCTSLSVSSSWSGNAPHSYFPSSAISFGGADFGPTNVTVDLPCGQCEGDLVVLFDNTGSDALTFSGNLSAVPPNTGTCSLTGELTPSVDFRIWH